MKVSIIIPTYNRAEYVGQAIKSALSQDYPDVEIIVADNASTDSTLTSLSEFTENEKVRVRINSVNVGMVNNWKDAIESLATGDWFMILSDDDYLVDESYVSKAVSLIRSHSDMKIVFSNGYLLMEPSGRIQRLILPYREVEPGINVFMNRGKLRPQDFTLCNVIFDRKAALAQKTFDNPENLSCDSELFLKLCLMGSVGVVKDYVSVYRVHDKNLIKTVRLEYSKLISSMESLFHAGSLAQEMFLEGHLECSREDLADWQSRNLVSGAQYILLHTLRFHPKFYQDSCDVIDGYCAGMVQRAMKSPMFRAKMFALALYNFVLRRAA